MSRWSLAVGKNTAIRKHRGKSTGKVTYENARIYIVARITGIRAGQDAQA